MPVRSYAEFMAAFNKDGTHPVTEISAASPGRHASPFIVIRHDAIAMVVNPLSFSDHLCLDVCTFIAGRRASSGAFGMTEGRRWDAFRDTGMTSYGWPAVELVSVIAGEQLTTRSPR
jgi:hypothetical protein